MTIGERVTWSSYGTQYFGKVEKATGQALTIRKENGPLAGKLCLKHSASVERV